MTNTPNQPRLAKSAPRSSARNDLDRIEATGSPWWAQAPATAMMCLRIAVAPVKFLDAAADMAVKLSFLAVIGAITLWYLKVIPETVVSAALNDVGTRILGILEASGLF